MPPPWAEIRGAVERRPRTEYRQVQFALEAADLKVRLGRSQRRRWSTSKRLLGKLDPGKLAVQARSAARSRTCSSRRRRPGRPLGQVLRALAQAGRPTTWRRCPGWAGPYGQLRGGRPTPGSWFDQAVKLAPSRAASCGWRLIEQLAQERKFADAATQYEAPGEGWSRTTPTWSATGAG